MTNLGETAGLRVERAASTRAALIEAGRRLFAEKGYHATGTPDLVAQAGVSRGALYHHFRDKEALFEAVFRDVEGELQNAAAASVAPYMGDNWRMLQHGLQSFLQLIAANRHIQRIVLLDGPVVLGWERWRELESEFTLGHLERMFARLAEQGVIAGKPAQALAHLLHAALNESALMIAHSDDPEATRVEVGGALHALVEGLK